MTGRYILIAAMAAGVSIAVAGLLAPSSTPAMPAAATGVADEGRPRYLFALGDEGSGPSLLDGNGRHQRWHLEHEKVRRGDRVVDPLRRAGVGAREADRVMRALADHIDARRIRAGTPITLVTDPMAGPGARLVRLEISTGFAETAVAARRVDGGFEAYRRALPTQTLVAHAEGTIDDSLYSAAVAANVSAQMTGRLIDLFSFDVDFQRDIRAGDTFEILYEARSAADGRDVAEGDILYARLKLSRRERAYYRHFGPQGQREYFNAEGRSVKRLLMKTPIDGARLTSRFGRRRHPILGYTRLHKGLDFGAGRGTPVKAAGDGVVERASRYGSYGHYIRLRHANGFQTAYAHLNGYARGIKAGKRVRQGQIIGYVGSTGRSTAPHLHYEVIRGGQPINPLTLDLPNGRTLAGAEKQAFDANRTALTALIADLKHVGGYARGDMAAQLALNPAAPDENRDR